MTSPIEQRPPGTSEAAQAVEAPVEPARPTATSPLVRAALLVVGTIALTFGVIGIIVPVLPTTPFLLLAAACYARASTRLYGWLLGQPALGPIITEWRRSRSLPPGAKRRALALVALTFGVSIVLVDEALVRAGLAVTGLVVMVLLARIPTSS
jgi:hypothetical protein